MKGLHIIIAIFLSSFICSCTDESVAIPLINKVETSLNKVETTLNPDEHIVEFLTIEIGEFIDSTFTMESDLNQFIEFSSISDKGIIKKVDMAAGINLYANLLNTEKVTEYPIYKIRNSNKVILIVKGKGLWDAIWAKILIDTKNNKIKKIEFDHKTETPGMGSQIRASQFENQFIGFKINFEKNTFSLLQDGKEIVKGEHQVNGVSGATFTSKGVVDMINIGLKIYEKYLR